ncbi:MAG: hypothetical protein IBX48_10520 [Thiomicrospira sp.]|uniref:hypothetical protein n=1 Tax=Thiomicrospira sp. TaxID=935 RepID=UPI001A0AF100|nr:hypothetical protein [Thiomicrospira sp.]MBE0494755.1 hypothetical protein [Thiomicrospira sp.]
MAKIDAVKETLNTLRLLFSLGVGLVVILTGTLIAKQQVNQLDIYFWLGALVVAIIIAGLAVILKTISNYTRLIGEL